MNVNQQNFSIIKKRLFLTCSPHCSCAKMSETKCERRNHSHTFQCNLHPLTREGEDDVYSKKALFKCLDGYLTYTLFIST